MPVSADGSASTRGRCVPGLGCEQGELFGSAQRRCAIGAWGPAGVIPGRAGSSRGATYVKVTATGPRIPR